MRTRKVISGTLAGLAVGAIAGILFAPKEGYETRKMLMNKGDDFYHKLKFKKAKKDAKKDVKNAVSDIKHSVS